MQQLMKVSIDMSRSKFVRIINQTLIVLFPIMLLGSFSEVIKYAFLTPSGFMATLFGIPNWLPFARQFAQLFGVIFHCTIDVIALYGAYGAAYFTMRLAGEAPASAGAIGILAFLIVAYKPGPDNDPGFSTALMAQGMLIALVVGYGCGQILLWFKKRRLSASAQLLMPLLIIMIIAAGINRLLGFVGALPIPAYLASFITRVGGGRAMLYVIGMGVLTDFLSWLGIGGPFTTSPSFTDAPSWANLQHALKVGSPWYAPYQYTDTTLFHSFANFGGNGIMFALMIAILFFSKRRHYRRVAQWSIFPAIFNNHYPMMLGIPVMYNPILLPPFVVAPLLNMVLAALLMKLNWLPAAVYPVPSGTPGPLIAFIGTNGNWLSLLLGGLLIGLDVLLYAPFVKLLDRVSENSGEQL